MTRQKARFGLLLILVLALLWAHAPEQVGAPVKLPTDLKVKARHATMEEKGENKALAVSYARALGYNQSQVKCLLTLWTRESRFDHFADNKRSTAYGIAQILGEKDSRASIQILHGIRYLGARYKGDSCLALRHHNRRGWY